MKRNYLFGLLLLSSGTVFAQGHDNHKAQADAAALPLSAEVRTLLKQEMQEIKKGMESLPFAVASGNWQQIEAVGIAVRDGYIMKTKLTAAQREELHRALPEQFQQLDQKFHYYAGMLSHAAHEHDIELVNYFVFKMNETCTACHAQYAQKTFPGFAKPNKHAEHMH